MGMDTMSTSTSMDTDTMSMSTRQRQVGFRGGGADGGR